MRKKETKEEYIRLNLSSAPMMSFPDDIGDKRIMTALRKEAIEGKKKKEKKEEQLEFLF